MTERLRGPDGRFLSDPKDVEDVARASDAVFSVAALRYMERWTRQERQRQAQRQRQAAEAAAALIPRRRYTWLPGGRVRLQAWVAHQPRDGQGRFIGNARRTHGTATSYRYGCRCPDCREAWRRRMTPYMRRYTKARR